MPDIIANKYKIVREIARSNDVVYEAIDTVMGRRLAVKELVIPPNLTGQGRRERVERFNREARATGKLAHPNIVTVYDYGEDNGRYFIAMEYLEGGTLRDLMQSRGAMPLAEALDIASQILSALSHAHVHQVVHRDVKPDNIHLLPGGQIKLTDFGIARLTEEASLTGDGQVFGTPSYMSPEQIEGRFIDHRSDLFSLAVVLYEMLAGRKPFTGDSVVSITYNIMNHQPAALVGVSYGVEQVLLKALSKDPRQRYSSAEEMRQELRNADAVPSMFLTPSNPPTGMGYGGYRTAAPSAHFPPAGVSPFPVFGGGIAPTYGGGHTAYAPPPVVAAPIPTAGGAGPFANWSQPNASIPPAYVPPPPPFPRRPPGPWISEGTKTFFAVVLWSVVIGVVLVGFVVLFLRAYDQQKSRAGQEAVQKIVAEGNRLFQADDLENAASRFEEALKVGSNTEAGKIARTNLAITYNRLGVRAFERGNPKAEQYFNAALDLYPDDASVASRKDADALKDIHYNLGRFYDRIGDRDRALREWQTAKEGGRIGGENPAAPGDNTSVQSRYERAQAHFNAGMEAYNNGDKEAARENWQKALGEAPGSDVAQKAQQNLDQTANKPDFGN